MIEKHLLRFCVISFVIIINAIVIRRHNWYNDICFGQMHLVCQFIMIHTWYNYLLCIVDIIILYCIPKLLSFRDMDMFVIVIASCTLIIIMHIVL